MIRRLLIRAISAVALGAMLVNSGVAAPITPPNMQQATTIAAGDLLLVWPVATEGPLKNIQWATAQAAMLSAIGGTYLQSANNLSDLASVSAAQTNLGLGAAATEPLSAFLQPSNNLSDLTNVATARSHLGVTATGADTTYAYRANNLSDLASATTARTNLGLGAAATQPLTAFLQPSNNLSDVTTPATARTNLGLGGAAVLNVGTATGTVAAGNDSRFGGPTQNSQSASYTFLASDAGGQVFHPSADTTARTWTIPANASVAYAVGTKLELVNDCSAGVITLQITTDTLEWFPAGTTGTRTLPACSMATITKIAATEWAIVGLGVT